MRRVTEAATPAAAVVELGAEDAIAVELEVHTLV
jgi:hypothetical protein